VLIAVINVNCNTNPTHPDLNLTKSTYPPPHTFSPALVSRILPTAMNLAQSRTDRQVATKLKLLGVMIDSYLGFDCHAKEVARACNYKHASIYSEFTKCVFLCH